MLEVHVYGLLIKKINPNYTINENIMLHLPYENNETLNKIISSLDFEQTDLGDCFVNFRYADIYRDGNKKLPDKARIALFSKGMSHIDFMANRVYGSKKWG